MLRASSVPGDHAGASSDTTLDAKHDQTNQRLALLVLAANGLSVFSLPETGVVDIGRADECQVQLRDPLVSRRHASLRLRPLAVEDHGSANGTWVGSVRLEPNEPFSLSEGQVLHVGDAMLIVRRGPNAVPTAGSGSTAQSLLVRQRIASDPLMIELYARAERLAVGDIPILIAGETGVGKELLAEAIHAGSGRSRGPFVRVDCAALGEALLETELFGRERGAFAGAVAAGRGLIEAADGGTVFLDEVAELPLPLQAKLLRVLEAGEITPVGGLHPRAISVRFLAATNRDLRAQTEAGTFRADLLYRLNGASITIPPLRQRPLDIIPLATEFLHVTGQLALHRAPQLAPDALARLKAHTWPGNARELRHVIERAVLVCDGLSITASDLMFDDQSSGAVEREHKNALPEPALEMNAHSATVRPRLDADPESPAPLQQARERIQRALAECGGNQSRAAEHLGIPRRTLVRKIAQLRLPRPRSQD